MIVMPITNDEELEVALERCLELMHSDPELYSPDGDELMMTIKVIEKYEDKWYSLVDSEIIQK